VAIGGEAEDKRVAVGGDFVLSWSQHCLVVDSGVMQLRGGTACRDNVHLSGVYARNSLAVSISSSQLISRLVATARLGCVLHLDPVALLAVEVGEV
jgi:hypothetical protein